MGVVHNQHGVPYHGGSGELHETLVTKLLQGIRIALRVRKFPVTNVVGVGSILDPAMLQPQLSWAGAGDFKELGALWV